MPHSVIELDQLTKTYGASRGVTDISLTVEEGSIIGFLGPNGAGKSTTMNMLVGLTHPTRGYGYIFGKDIVKDSVTIREDTGFLTSDMALDRNLTGRQQLEYFSRLRGRYDKQYVQELADRLECALDRKIKTLSRGNRQKVALVAALMHKPKLLLLDEPTSGLDPLMQVEFNKIILERRAAGCTAFISSHVLSEIQELCDRMIFIREGQVIANKTLDELTEGAPKQIRLITDDAKLAKELRVLQGTSALSVKGRQVSLAYTGQIEALLRILSARSIADLVIEDADLEELFIKFYESGDEAKHAK